LKTADIVRGIDAAGRDERTLSSAIRKIKWRLIPILCLSFLFNYIDRVNIVFVRSYLECDLGIGAAAYGVGAGLFFISYFVFQVPANILLCKFGARIWLSCIVMLWGAVCMLMAVIQDAVGFYVMRLLLGTAEAGFVPGVMYYFSHWLPDKARIKAIAWFMMSGILAGVVSGPLSYLLLQLDGLRLHPWQWLFLVEGFASVLMGLILLRVLVSMPNQAKWLSHDECRILVQCIHLEKRQSAPSIAANTRWHALCRDPQYFLFSFLYFCLHLPFYAVLFWLPQLIRQSDPNRDAFEIGVINAIPWVLTMLAMTLWAQHDRGDRFRKAGLAIAIALSAAGCYLSTLPPTSLAFVGVCVTASGSALAANILWSIAQRYADPTIAAVAFAMMNSMGALSGFVAPTLFGFLEALYGSVASGFRGLALLALIGAVGVYFIRSTRQ